MINVVIWYDLKQVELATAHKSGKIK